MSSTLIPSIHYFPFLTPPAPQSHAIPLLKRRRTRLTERRNLYTETADLSEEEEDVDDVLHRIKEQGLEFYIPLGKTATAQEERADVCFPFFNLELFRTVTTSIDYCVCSG